MSTETPLLSEGFQRLYCDATVFASFSNFHPISFARVLPFQSQDPIADDEQLIGAETALLADQNDLTRREVIEAYVKCGLLPEADADNVKSAIDYFDKDFFDLMGQVYANAGMFICALRWYREFIQALEPQNESERQGFTSDEGVYASVGYCLYSLGLFEEAIAWTKSCMGPVPIADVVCRTLLGYEAKQADGKILGIERAGPRTRYTLGAVDSARLCQAVPQLKTAMDAFAPFQEIYIEVLAGDAPGPEPGPEDYPFRFERDSTDLPRHKMNLLFATCAQADALVERGYTSEAKQLLREAALLEPGADFVMERLRAPG